MRRGHTANRWQNGNPDPAGNWYTIETLWTAFAIPAFVDQQKITEMVASLDWRPAPLLSGTN